MLPSTIALARMTGAPAVPPRPRVVPLLFMTIFPLLPDTAMALLMALASVAVLPRLLGAEVTAGGVK